ncbi:MAG: hypothetical protein HY958_11550 [Bacteroidia bacterium]|nr:hypothetical protein [Bacteroidia bacterium]
MKNIARIVALMLVVAFCFNANAQKLKKFGMDFKKKHYPVIGDVRIPYTDVIDYFGYVKPGEPGDETKNGKKYYYLYVWIPVVAPEIGIRMVSPVTSLTPGKASFVSPAWEGGKADKKNFFDTWISFERAEGIFKKEDILAKGKSCNWNSYGQNDDSSELPKQPSGNKYNSVLRITSEISNPLKALVVGLYRIGFTTYKVGEVQGSFYAQVGAPVKLPGVVIAKDLESLVKMMDQKK